MKEREERYWESWIKGEDEKDSSCSFEILKREWRAGDSVSFTFHDKNCIVSRNKGSLSKKCCNNGLSYYGNVLFSLRVS